MHDTLSTPARQLVALLPAPRLGRGGAGARDAARLGRRPRRPTAARRRSSRCSGASSAGACWRRSCPSGRASWSTRSRPRCCSACSPIPTRGSAPIPPRRATPCSTPRSPPPGRRRARRWAPTPPPGAGAALHQVRIRHPLSRIPAIAAAFPPIEGEGSGGDSYTVDGALGAGRAAGTSAAARATCR